MQVQVIDRDGDVHSLDLVKHAEDNLMEVLKDQGFDVDGTCAGSASCGTCHIYLEQGELGERNSDEALTLGGLIHESHNSRLACQVNTKEVITDVTIRLAPGEFE